MDQLLILPDEFKTMGLVVIASSGATIAVSFGHALYYWNQRKAQTTGFLKALACRMKAVFFTFGLVFCFDIIAGIGLAVNYTYGAWYAIVVLVAGAKLLFTAAGIWLLLLYHKEKENAEDEAGK